MADARSPYAGSSELVALGLTVRELRELRGVTQKAVGFDAGVGDYYVGGVECAWLNPTFVLLMRVARTLRFTPGELIDRYERRLAVIDPHAGHDAPACPTDEALAHVAALNVRWAGFRHAAEARRARSRMRSWT
ncbi:MAG: helix-turn-helix domain-containing protein [Conexibacter sp.]